MKQKQNLRQLKLASVDDTFAASANVEQLNEQLNSAVAKIQSLRSDFTKGLGDAHLEHIQLVNESNSIENNMYLNVGEKDEADAMLLKNKLGGRARFVEANHTERIKTSEERKKERNAASAHPADKQGSESLLFRIPCHGQENLKDVFTWNFE